MNTPAIHLEGLRKSYGSQLVLDSVNLSVLPGTVTALLGQNGAGKTTIVHILSTLLRPDDGSANVAGFDVEREPAGVRSQIGLTGQFSAVDTLLTGEENLRLIARLRHLGAKQARARVDELLTQFELSDAARKPLATYSRGMRRRLDLAMTLVTAPSVLFLDEPTTGLDPRSRHTMWDIVRSLVADGTTVLLTTQYLDEADQLADRIALLHEGRFVADGSPADLKQLVPGGHVKLRFAHRSALDTAAKLIENTTIDDSNLTLSIPNSGSGDDAADTDRSRATGGTRTIRIALDRLNQAGVEPMELSTHSPDLDDVFFALTGRADSKGFAS